jgi:hypothetical protein
MKKPYTLVSNTRAKKPYVVGHYATRRAAEQALELYRRKNGLSIDMMRKYPGQGIEELWCDLKILGPDV